MKVIKPGTLKEWSTEVTCTGAGNYDQNPAIPCGAILEVELGDLFVTTSHARDETDYFVTIECPECHCHTDLSEGKVPDAIRHHLIAEHQKKYAVTAPKPYLFNLADYLKGSA